MKTITKLWILIVVLIALAPLGLVLPRFFKAGTAWGEWGLDELKAFIGYIPKGLAGLAGLWSAPFCGYGSGSAGYALSAVVGVAFTVCAILLIGKFLIKRR